MKQETLSTKLEFDVQVKIGDDFVCLRYDIPYPLSNWVLGNKAEDCYILPRVFYDKHSKKGAKFFISGSKQLREQKHYVFNKKYINAYLNGKCSLYEYDGDKVLNDQWSSFDTKQDQIYYFNSWNNYLMRNGEYVPALQTVKMWSTIYNPDEIMKASKRFKKKIRKVEIIDNDVYLNHPISGYRLTHVTVEVNKNEIEKFTDLTCHEKMDWVADILKIDRLPRSSLCE